MVKDELGWFLNGTRKRKLKGERRRLLELVLEWPKELTTIRPGTRRMVLLGCGFEKYGYPAKLRFKGLLRLLSFRFRRLCFCCVEAAGEIAMLVIGRQFLQPI